MTKEIILTYETDLFPPGSVGIIQSRKAPVDWTDDKGYTIVTPHLTVEYFSLAKRRYRFYAPNLTPRFLDRVDQYPSRVLSTPLGPLLLGSLESTVCASVILDSFPELLHTGQAVFQVQSYTGAIQTSVRATFDDSLALFRVMFQLVYLHDNTSSLNLLFNVDSDMRWVALLKLGMAYFDKRLCSLVGKGRLELSDLARVLLFNTSTVRRRLGRELIDLLG